MKRSQRIPLFLVLTVLCLSAGPAQALFEELAVSPRALAMGEAGTAVSGDAWTFSRNPGQLALLDRSYASTSTVKPFGIGAFQQTAVGLSLPVSDKLGGLAFGVRHWSVNRSDVDLQVEQTYSLSHGFTLFHDANSSAHIGWTVNAYNAEFAETVGGIDPGSAWTVGIDAGAVVTLHTRLRAGVFARNLNSPTIGEDDEELRQMVSAGLAYTPYNGVTTAFDIRSQLGEEFRFHGGVEIALTRALDLRVGVQTDPNKLSGGFGINLPRLLTFDYAFITGGEVLDATHQFGMTLRLGGRAQ